MIAANRHRERLTNEEEEFHQAQADMVYPLTSIQYSAPQVALLEDTGPEQAMTDILKHQTSMKLECLREFEGKFSSSYQKSQRFCHHFANVQKIFAVSEQFRDSSKFQNF